MRSLGLACVSLLVLFVGGCPSEAVYDCPGDGAYVEAGIGRYCAYGVVIGGFDCPTDLPNRFEFPSEDPSVPSGFVCSDRPFGSRDDVPMTVCDRVPACRPRADAGATDGGIRADSDLCACVTAADCAPVEPGSCRAPTCDDCTCSTRIDPSLCDPGSTCEVTGRCVPDGPPSECERLGGTCSLPMGFPTPSVLCPEGSVAIGGSETGLGGYRQLGCGNVEAGPLACCVPTFDCDGEECPVVSICVRRSGPAPGVVTCEDRPSECADAMDCAAPCTAETDCIEAVCGTFLDSASIDGTRFECPGA